MKTGAYDIIEQIKEYPEFRAVQIVHILEALQGKLVEQAQLAKDMGNDESREIDLAYGVLLEGAISGIKSFTSNVWGLTDKETRDMFE